MCISNRNWRYSWLFLCLGISVTSHGESVSPNRSAANPITPVIDTSKRKPIDSSVSLYIEPAEQTWAFAPHKDKFQPSAILDLSYLNTPITKPEQRITLSEDKNSFALANGEAVRFWSINVSGDKLKPAQIDQQIRFLAKRGVNMVRLHAAINAKGKLSNLNDINQKVLDQTFLYVAALKKYGVYLTYSPYWGHDVRRSGWNKSIGKDWPVPRSKKSNDLTGLLFFDPILQSAYQRWIKQLFTTVNPYTKLALKDDPVLAIFQIQNEDSLLFWTFKTIQDEDLDVLRQQYGLWLQQKYGSLAATRKQWQEALPEGSPVADDWENGLISFADTWQLTQQQKNKPAETRVNDQTQFLVATMKGFNQKIINYLREEIGTNVLINPGNWRSASFERLDDLERYSYSDGDVMALNRYVSSNHFGDKNGWAIINGQKYRDASVLLSPSALPIAIKQPAGYPFIVTESGWIPPISFQAEGPFLVSAFQSLTGVDGFYWFTAGDPQWRQPSSANGFFPSLGKWVTQGPMIVGQFPAAAFAYRQGLIAPGTNSITEFRSLDDMLARNKSIIFENKGFDPNRDKEWIEQKEQANGLAYLLGPVQVHYHTGKAIPDQINLGNNTANQRPLVSNNKQIVWDIPSGIAAINAPSVQAGCGFFAGSTINALDLAMTIQSPYACVWVVALDNKPIGQSEKLLIQMATRQFPTDWQTKPSNWTKNANSYVGREIVNYGKAPWRVENLQGKITINNRHINSATVLNGNGEAKADLPLKIAGGQLHLSLPPSALYVLLERRTAKDIR